MQGNHITNQRGMTLLEILFATMILSVGLLSIMSVFPLGAERHRESVQDAKSAIIVDSLKDAIMVGVKYPYASEDSSGADADVKIVIVHDGLGGVTDGVPEGRAVITLPRTARALERNDDTGSDEGFDIKYEMNDPVRYPDHAEQEVYHLGQILLKDDADNQYFNNRDSLSGYSFDIEIREAVTSRRPRSDYKNPNSEITDSKVRVYDLASQNHEVYEFTIRIYSKWRERTGSEIAYNRENAKLVRVYSFIVSLSQVKR